MSGAEGYQKVARDQEEIAQFLVKNDENGR
jgi:hypothetical protein